MQSIFLSYYHRLMLWTLTGSHSVERLADAAVLLRVIEKVRLTDEESITTEFRANGSQIAWKLPEAGYGDKLVEFENEEARALAGVIEGARGVRVSDAEWLMKTLEKLQQPAAKPVETAVTAAGGRNHDADDVR